MRLIDADEYVKSMCNSCDGSCDKVDCDCLNCHEDCRCEFARELDDFPTIEAVPLSVIEDIKAYVHNYIILSEAEEEKLLGFIDRKIAEAKEATDKAPNEVKPFIDKDIIFI